MGKLTRLYGRASWIFLIAGNALLFGTAFYFIYFKTPDFYDKLTESITGNQALMKKIGGWKESQFKYSDSLDSNNSFKITIIGMCDSSSVVIRGFYTDNDYTATDTIINICK